MDGKRSGGLTFIISKTPRSCIICLDPGRRRTSWACTRGRKLRKERGKQRRNSTRDRLALPPHCARMNNISITGGVNPLSYFTLRPPGDIVIEFCRFSLLFLIIDSVPCFFRPFCDAQWTGLDENIFFPYLLEVPSNFSEANGWNFTWRLLKTFQRSPFPFSS